MRDKGVTNNKKMLPVLIVLVVFILLGNQFQKEEVRNVEVNEKNFDVVDSIDQALLSDRLSSEYRENLLDKALQYNLVQTFEDQQISVLESNRTIQIHKVWNSHFDFYILYSVNLLPKDEKPIDLPYITFNKMTLHNEEGQTIDLHVDPYEDETRYNGFVYNNRYYTSLWITTGIDGTFDTILQEWNHSNTVDTDLVSNLFHQVNQISLENVNFVNKNVEKVPLDPIPLKMNLTSITDPLEVFQIDKTIPLTSRTSIELKRNEIGLLGNRLMIDLGENKDEIRKLDYTLNGQRERSLIERTDQGEQFLYIDRYVSDVNQLNVQFTKAKVPTDDEFDYTLGKDKMDKYKKQLTGEGNPPQFELNEPIGKIHEKQLMKAMNLDLRKVHGDQKAVSLNISAETESGESFWLYDYGKYLDIISQGNQAPYMDATPFVEVTNNNGERLDVVDVSGNSTSGHSELSLMFDKEDFMKEEELHFRFFHFSKSIPLDTSLNKVPLKEK